MGWLSDTALRFAALTGRTELVRALLGDPNVDPNTICGGGQTALHSAARSGSTDVVGLLLRMPCIEPRRADNAGRTAYDVACAMQQQQQQQLHVEAGEEAVAAGGGGGGMYEYTSVTTVSNLLVWQSMHVNVHTSTRTLSLICQQSALIVLFAAALMSMCACLSVWATM